MNGKLKSCIVKLNFVPSRCVKFWYEKQGGLVYYLATRMTGQEIYVYEFSLQQNFSRKMKASKRQIKDFYFQTRLSVRNILIIFLKEIRIFVKNFKLNPYKI